MNPEPSTSRGIEKETNLEIAQEEFEKTVTTPELKATISVRRRHRMPAQFMSADLLFEIRFSQSRQGNLSLLSCLVGIYHVILELVRKLKTFFDDDKTRLCFFSCSAGDQISGLYSGGYELYKTKERVLANSIIMPLFNYLCSKSEVSLDDSLIVKSCVLSFKHSSFQQKNKKREANQSR